ncbi:uracil-DNA glycosylase [Ammonifex thiophilus]|uniref:uracil-DNA glycosylase n=1 Tax=Ammonifex thiophilus TaxID=444093 RepID=UPI003B82C8FF
MARATRSASGGLQLTLEDLAVPQTLEELEAVVKNCRKCPLAAGRTNVVFGEGNPHALLMFIGEGPGAEEDRQGRPFVGPAGQLLDRILAACNIKREEVYIANIVKCRPPGNRVPTKEEAEACLPYLIRQIELIRPKIIVLLGATALQYLMGSGARITKVRGQWLGPFYGAQVMPTYHPAALLRDPSKKRPAWEDFKKIRDAYFNLKKQGL